MPPTLLLGVCDHSTAAATPDLLEALRRTHDVKVILTEGCKVFLPSAPEGAVDDAQEWYQWQKVLQRSALVVFGPRDCPQAAHAFGTPGRSGCCAPVCYSEPAPAWRARNARRPCV